MKPKPQRSPTRRFTDSMSALMNLAHQERYGEAEALARELTRRFPKDGEGWKALGALLKLHGKGAEALFPMQKATELLPEDPEVHYIFAAILQDHGLFAEAEASLRRALSIRPHFEEALRSLHDTFIEIVSATRHDLAGFQQTPLGQSLHRLSHDRRLVPHISFDNSAGLPEIYNQRIHAESAADILVFVHDDVWIDDSFLADRVIDGLEIYQVIGVAGNTRLAPSHESWFSTVGGVVLPRLSGAVAHGETPFGRIAHYGETPRKCELLDGVLFAARRSVLREKGVALDARFSFHFYDLDFCRTARQKGLTLGTWPMAITHKSGGAFRSPEWEEALAIYKAKWPEP